MILCSSPFTPAHPAGAEPLPDQASCRRCAVRLTVPPPPGVWQLSGGHPTASPAKSQEETYGHQRPGKIIVSLILCRRRQRRRLSRGVYAGSVSASHTASASSLTICSAGALQRCVYPAARFTVACL